MHRHWFDIIVPRDLRVALVASVPPWALLVGVFGYMLGAFEAEQTEDTSSALGTALFFATVNVFSVVAGAVVVRRSQHLLDQLRLTCSDEVRLAFRSRLGSSSRRSIVSILVMSLAAGLAQNMVLQETIVGVFTAITSSRIALAGAVGAMLTWVVITFVVVTFVRNARAFAEIGEHHLEVDLLHAEKHSLLGRAALMPTLALLGTQILYPLLWLGGEFNVSAVIPGFLVTLAALIYLFLRSTLPLHWRLRQAKELLIEQVNLRIETERAKQSESTASVVELQALLDHRAYIQNCPEWPFKMTTIARWSLYLLIPPLTWVGAALIENVVDFALS